MIRLLKKIYSFIKIYGLSKGFAVIWWGILNNLPQVLGRPILFKRLKNMEDRIVGILSSEIDAFRLESSQTEGRISGGRIWVCWLQGENKMPDVCRICLNALRRHANEHEIVVINLENYMQYCTIPQYIVDAYHSGKIIHAHFADIIRTCLLYERGGAWIDATLLSTRNLPDVLFSSVFYSCKFPPKRYFIEDGKWQNYFLCATPKSPMFQFVRMCFFEYLKKNIPFADYFLMNYFMQIGYDKVPEIRKVVDELPYNNQETWNLEPKLNLPCSEEEFKRILNSDTFLFKLSYKNALVKEVNGQPTLYGRIKNEFI